MAQQNDARSRMTFAHELGHLVMHPGAVKLRSEAALKPSQVKYYESAEWQAKKFAALFLAPDHIAVEFDTPVQLAASCNISRQAADIRFKETAHLRKSRPLAGSVTEIISKYKKS